MLSLACPYRWQSRARASSTLLLVNPLQRHQAFFLAEEPQCTPLTALPGRCFVHRWAARRLEAFLAAQCPCRSRAPMCLWRSAKQTPGAVEVPQRCFEAPAPRGNRLVFPFNLATMLSVRLCLWWCRGLAIDSLPWGARRATTKEERRTRIFGTKLLQHGKHAGRSSPTQPSAASRVRPCPCRPTAPTWPSASRLAPAAKAASVCLFSTRRAPVTGHCTDRPSWATHRGTNSASPCRCRTTATASRLALRKETATRGTRGCTSGTVLNGGSTG
jgi:hypothetical protein